MEDGSALQSAPTTWSAVIRSGAALEAFDETEE
jgi:hypothetical protein